MKNFYVATINFNLSDNHSIQHEIAVSTEKAYKSDFTKAVQSFIEQSKIKMSDFNFTSVDYVINEKSYKKAPKNFIKLKT